MLLCELVGSGVGGLNVGALGLVRSVAVGMNVGAGRGLGPLACRVVDRRAGDGTAWCGLCGQHLALHVDLDWPRLSLLARLELYSS